ncbi:MAG: retroviral-like aspartic protease family protein [Defluviitaleaceae bacterium]|nr:retroviral-like aspartic protease family protein [Defluviitaleaceae bacterium]
MKEITFKYKIPMKFVQHRYKVDLGIGLKLPLLRPKPLLTIIDTGSQNTLWTLKMADRWGKEKNHKQNIVIGSREYKATLYTLNYVHFGDLCIRNLPVLAADYQGVLENNFLLGASVLKNWQFCLDSGTNELYFNEISTKYNYFFDKENNYQEVYIPEEDEDDAPIGNPVNQQARSVDRPPKTI